MKSPLPEDIRMLAADLRRDSDKLESLLPPSGLVGNHASELELMKEHINKIGQTFQKLQSGRALRRGNKKPSTALLRSRRSLLLIPGRN